MPKNGATEQAGDRGDLPSLVAAAQLAATGSALTYWHRLLDSAARHQAGLAAVMHEVASRPAGREADGQTDEQLRATIDDLRAYLREVGEIAMQEARTLQAKLDGLGEELAQAASPPDPAAPHRRRWKVKG